MTAIGARLKWCMKRTWNLSGYLNVNQLQSSPRPKENEKKKKKKKKEEEEEEEEEEEVKEGNSRR